MEGFSGLSLRLVEGVAEVAVTLGASDKMTFSPSSRLSSTSSGGGDSLEPEGPASACARSICSAMSIRSRCSSEVVKRSFFNEASCNENESKQMSPKDRNRSTRLFSKSLRTAINPCYEPPLFCFVYLSHSHTAKDDDHFSLLNVCQPPFKIEQAGHVRPDKDWTERANLSAETLKIRGGHPGQRCSPHMPASRSR